LILEVLWLINILEWSLTCWGINCLFRVYDVWYMLDLSCTCLFCLYLIWIFRSILFLTLGYWRYCLSIYNSLSQYSPYHWFLNFFFNQLWVLSWLLGSALSSSGHFASLFFQNSLDYSIHHLSLILVQRDHYWRFEVSPNSIIK